MITKSIINWFLSVLGSFVALINPPAAFTEDLVEHLDFEAVGGWVGVMDPFVPISALSFAVVFGLGMVGVVLTVIIVKMVVSYVTGGGGSV